MVILKSIVILLLAVSTQVLALPTNQTELINPARLDSASPKGPPNPAPQDPVLQGPVPQDPTPKDPAPHDPAPQDSAPQNPAPPKPSSTTPSPTKPTHSKAEKARSMLDALARLYSKPRPEPEPVYPGLSPFNPGPVLLNAGLKPINSSRPSHPAFTPQPDLLPDPNNTLMIGQPTWHCDYRFQLSGKKNHYTLRGRNWNITGERLEEAVQVVVYNTPEWGAMPKGGPDLEGHYFPGPKVTDDTISFRYSDKYVPDGVTPAPGVQEFSAEFHIPTNPEGMTRELELEFERMLSKRPKNSAARTLGIKCSKMLDDEDTPWHPAPRPSEIIEAPKAPKAPEFRTRRFMF